MLLKQIMTRLDHRWFTENVSETIDQNDVVVVAEDFFFFLAVTVV